MDVDTAFQAAISAERASTQGLQRKEAELKEAKKVLKEAKQDQSRAEETLMEADDSETEAAQVALDEANKVVSEALGEVSTLLRGVKVLKQAAMAARSGNVWKKAYEAVVDARLAVVKEELLARFEDWSLPEDLDSARGSLESLCNEFFETPASAPEPMIPISPLDLGSRSTTTQFINTAVLAQSEPTDMEMESTARTLRAKDGIADRLLSKNLNSEHAL